MLKEAFGLEIERERVRDSRHVLCESSRTGSMPKKQTPRLESQDPSATNHSQRSTPHEECPRRMPKKACPAKTPLEARPTNHVPQSLPDRANPTNWAPRRRRRVRRWHLPRSLRRVVPVARSRQRCSDCVKVRGVGSERSAAARDARGRYHPARWRDALSQLGEVGSRPLVGLSVWRVRFR